MVASVPIERNAATAEWNDPDPSGPDPLPEKLAQNGNVVGNVVAGQSPFGLDAVGMQAGAACGVTPNPEAGTTSLVNAVGRPVSWLTGITPDGTTPKYAGSLPCVTRSGTCTVKIKCELAEFGDGAKDTVVWMPSEPALRVSVVPCVVKSPMTLAARPFTQLGPLLQPLICRVARVAGHPAVPQIGR